MAGKPFKPRTHDDGRSRTLADKPAGTGPATSDARNAMDLAGTYSDFLPRDGQMASAVRSFDWSRTSLGPIGSWSASLKMTLRLVLNSRQPMCFWWGPDLTSFHNDAYAPMLGGRAEGALGRPFKDLWSDVWEDVLPLVHEVLAGRPTWVENLPLTMTRNGFDEATYWTFAYSPLHEDDGRVAGILNIVTETTGAIHSQQALEKANGDLAQALAAAQAHIDEQTRLERRQRLLQRELVHRMKNTLSMVQAIVGQTLRNAQDPKLAADVIAERLGALSRAQDILTETSWKGAAIDDVVSNALAPHRDEDRIVWEGPRVELSAQQALGLSLALHELGTNAAKYGALSTSAGLVSISWLIADDGAFRFVWREAGGPEVEPPSRRGFGSRLTERIVAGYFSGRSQIRYEPAGVVFELQGKIEQGFN